MFSHVFWKNRVWLHQFKWKSTCKFEARHTKLFCTQDNNESLFENFDSLAGSGGKEETVNESIESELTYFADEQLKLSEIPQPTHRKTSVKQMLAYTNKILYGPLLETSAQRKRGIEITEGETGDSQKARKRKKSKKNKPVMTLQPLVSRPENAHLLGTFPGHESKSVDKFHHQRVKIKHQHETGTSSDSKNFIPGNKILIFKKSSKDSIKYDNFVFNDIPNIQKIYVSSWNQGKDQCDNDDNESGISETINGDILSNSNAVQDKAPESTYLASCPSDVKTENKQEIEQQLESFREKSFLLSVDNSKFTSVPSVIDCEMIESFPLEKTESPGKVSTTLMNKDENILTIGMFDGGYQRLPSVSTILEATMPEDQRRILERWKAKMIKELGEEGFEEYRKGLFDKGKLLHGCIQSELTGISPSVENMPTVQGFWTSVSHVLPKISSVSVLESRLVHPYLYYQGAVDCVAAYKGMPVLIDWKTSTKPKLTLKAMYDNPLQVVAYLGALNYDNSYQFSHQVQSAMLVVAYDTGLPAHVHIIDKDKCQAYWKVWCARLVQFWRQLEIKDSL